MLNVRLLFLCSLLLYEGQTAGPVWPPNYKIIVEGDPCAEDENAEKTSSIRFVFDEMTDEGSSSSQPAATQADTSSSSSAAPLEPAEQLKLLANSYAFQDKLEEAILCYSKAINLKPSEPKYYRNRGLCLSRLKKIDLAILDYKAALSIEPESVRCLVYMGRALLHEGNLDEAKEHVENAFVYGQQQKLIDQVMYQVTVLRDEIRLKIKDRDRQRHRELYFFLNGLIMKNMQKEINKAVSPEMVRGIELQHDEYQKELKAAFPGVDEEQQTVTYDPEYLCDTLVNFELLKDPVTTPSGITYERAQIIRHLEHHHDDPTSRLPLTSQQLRPNKLLKEAIEDYMRIRGLTHD